MVGHRKGVVSRLKVALFINTLEHWELGDPEVFRLPFADRWGSERYAQCTERSASLSMLIGHAENEVARCCAIALGNRRLFFVVQESLKW